MYKLLVVDDEKIVIDGLTSATNWKEHHIEIIGTASDGKEALQKIIEKQPHIVLADIRIPSMNGLDLIKEARALNLEIVFIIISGYSEFRYAKRALELEAVDYLVKPIEVDEIVQSVKKAIGKYEKLKEEKQMDTKMKEYMTELEEKHVLDYILGQEVQQSNQNKKINPFCFAAIDLSDEKMDARIKKEMLPSLMIRLKNLLVERGFECFVYRIEKRIVIMFTLSNLTLTDGLLKDVISLIYHEIRMQPTLGISHTYEHLSDINQAYCEAIEALKIGIYTNQLFTYYHDVENLNNTIGPSIINKIDGFFKKSDKDVLREMRSLNEDIFHYSTKSKLSPQKTKYLCFKVVNLFLEYIESEYELKNLFGERFLLYEELNRLQSLNEIREWLQSILTKATEHLNENRISHYDKFIFELKTYLNTNFNQPIVLEDLGKHFYKNPAYLCSLFSKAVGQTIFEYITSIRMEHAKKLLRTSNQKISDICVQVGYENHKYFNQVFKKQIGASPSQYRSEHLVKQKLD